MVNLCDQNCCKIQSQEPNFKKLPGGPEGMPLNPLAFSMLHTMPMSKPSPHSLLLYATGLQNSLNSDSIPSYKFIIWALNYSCNDHD